MWAPLPPLGWKYLAEDLQLVVGEYLFRPGWMALAALALCWIFWRLGGPSLTAELAAALAAVRERPRLALALIAAASALASCALGHRVLGGHPHTQDDIAYLFQARTFAEGRLWMPVPRDGLLPAFQTVFLLADGDRWYGKYPPGWPAVLAPAARFGLETLVNPLLNALALLLFHRLLRRRWPAGWALAGTALLAASPFFIAMGASLLTHPLALVLVLLVADGVERSPELSGALLAGVALGVLHTARPLDALAVGLPAALVAAARYRAAGLSAREWAVRVAAVALPGLLAIGLVLAYNQSLTGDPLLSPFLKHNPRDRPGFGPEVGTFEPEGHNLMKSAANLAFNMAAFNEDAFGWPGIALLVVAFGLCARARLSPLERLLLAIAAGLGLAYATFMGHGIAFGPRYYHPWLPLAVVAVLRAGAELLRRAAGPGAEAPAGTLEDPRAPRLALLAFVLGVLGLSTYAPQRITGYVDYFNVLSDPRPALAAVPADATLVVVPDIKWHQRAAFDSFFGAHGADPWAAPRTFARDGPWVADGRLARAFPGRKLARIPEAALKALFEPKSAASP